MKIRIYMSCHHFNKKLENPITISQHPYHPYKSTEQEKSENLALHDFKGEKFSDIDPSYKNIQCTIII